MSGDFNARIPASLGGDGDTSLAEFVAIVNAALASTDAGYIIDLAAWLDFKNNEGPAALCA